MTKTNYPRTPDGRYFVAKRRLWRCSDPNLSEAARRQHVENLMNARRAVKSAVDANAEKAARGAVDRAKRALGERGPVWWSDGAPDEGRKHPKNTSYADWWAALDAEARRAGGES